MGYRSNYFDENDAPKDLTTLQIRSTYWCQKKKLL